MGITLTNCYEKKDNESDLKEEEDDKPKLKKYKSIKQVIQNSKQKQEIMQEIMLSSPINSNSSTEIKKKKNFKKIMDKKPNDIDYYSTPIKNNKEVDLSNGDINNKLESMKNLKGLSISSSSKQLFFPFDEGHKQQYLLPKTFSFSNIPQEEDLTKKLEIYFENEVKKQKKNLISIDELIIEGVIETQYKLDDMNLTKTKIFYIISNVYIYEFHYAFNSSNDKILETSLSCKKKVNLVSIDTLFINSNYSHLSIILNPKYEKNILFEIKNLTNPDVCLFSAFCICQLMFTNFSQIKTIISLPDNTLLGDYLKSKKSLSGTPPPSNQSFNEYFNISITNFFNKITEIIPCDMNESLIKFIPLSKIETKFTEIKIGKILIITNKKIIECPSDLLNKINNLDEEIHGILSEADYNSINFIPWNKG
jgi:hypothetical protein